MKENAGPGSQRNQATSQTTYRSAHCSRNKNLRRPECRATVMGVVTHSWTFGCRTRQPGNNAKPTRSSFMELSAGQTPKRSSALLPERPSQSTAWKPAARAVQLSNNEASTVPAATRALLSMVQQSHSSCKSRSSYRAGPSALAVSTAGHLAPMATRLPRPT